MNTKLIPIFIALIAISIVTVQSVSAWKFAAVGDIECKGADRILGFIKTNTPEAKRVLLLGDLGYGSTSKCIKTSCDKFGLNCIPTVGNHDKASDIKKVFGKGDGVGTYQTNNVRFLGVNSELSISTVKAKVASLLNKYQNDSNIDFIIPFQHKPFVTNPSAHHGEGDAKGYRAALLPLYQAAEKVKLVLFGHNHGYQQCDVGDIAFITSGQGGRDPYSWGSKTDDNCHNQATGGIGYLEVDVDNHSLSWKRVFTK